jgi:deazaflavin-dependent oxidoreductase (nitroreductase family)
VFYLRDGERLVLCNVTPASERANPWTLNLRAHPLARVQIGRHVATYRAREADAAEAARYWPRLVAFWPAYEAHFARRRRRALFVLEPTPGASPWGDRSRATGLEGGIGPPTRADVG